MPRRRPEAAGDEAIAVGDEGKPDHASEMNKGDQAAHEMQPHRTCNRRAHGTRLAPDHYPQFATPLAIDEARVTGPFSSPSRRLQLTEPLGMMADRFAPRHYVDVAPQLNLDR